MSKKKETIIRNVLDKYDIDGDSEFTYSDLFENFIENKTHIFVNLELLTLRTIDESNTMSSENAPSSGKGLFGVIGSAFVSALKSLPDEVVDAAEEVSEDDEVLEDNDEKSAIVDEGLQLYWKGIYHEFEKYRDSQPDVAKNYFQKAAEKGNAESFFHISYYIKSRHERKSFLESELRNDNTEAQYLLGQYYRNKRHDGDHQRKRDDQEAKQLLEKAALKGHIPAQYELGRWYAHHYTSCMDTVIGSWTYYKYYYDNDYENAIKWIRKAADVGFPPAQMKLGYGG
ncbi:MAG: sel1 repeat family protein [Ruminococcus sp.]|nr:sel1 repeat family protein [Ruminococcus sp.]